ncbi:GNAT family N-acetyltransferase [Flavisolibacter tropicus]|uniref:GNAT family N-acetyltransferase n=1 Tax=Flavisolibacter tropicus TaxID=1492898 RepID=UPI000A839605|nr:GNAT family N-acetyltransferase [Flavisolibacter tropicus]
MEKLDNPVWYSLTETHQQFAIVYDEVKFYQPDYCPFGGFVAMEQTADALNKYARLADSFFVVGNRPGLPEGLILQNELACRQMVLDQQPALEITEEIVELQSQQYDELFDLVNLVQPGYFRKKTPLLGAYFGIYKDEKLVAVTGERMQMHEYTEVSAVVTHPDYTGKGYAKQLVAHAANKIFSENKFPYLHVADTNAGAISLYEKLGFVTRRKISFWHIVKTADDK